VVVAADGGPPGHVAGPGGGDADLMMFSPVWPQSNRPPAAQATGTGPPPWQTPAGLISGARRLAEMLRIGPADRIVLAAPVAQLYGVTAGLAAVLAGSAVTLLPTPTPGRIAEALVDASVVLGTPGTFRVVDELVQQARRTVPLRLALNGGGPDPSGLVISDGPAPSGDRPGFGVTGLVVLQDLVRRVVEVAGAKVALPWVESVLRECPGVRDAAVVDRVRPDGPRSLRGFVVTDAQVSGHDVVQFCRGRGLAAHEVPWIIQEVDRIPRTAGGEVDVRALAGPSR
jgi:acyl-coenzyme A synthetase/AMP-(fatty) acid ligase